MDDARPSPSSATTRKRGKKRRPSAARRALVREVMERWNLDSGAAGQVLDGKLDPEYVARTRRARENVRRNTPRSVLKEACTQGKPLILGMADGRQRKAEVREVTDYDVTIEDGACRKIELLYAFFPQHAKKLKRVLARDVAVAELGLRPAEKVRDRVDVRKMMLQRLIDEPPRARFTLTDGTVVVCRVQSFGGWEVDVSAKGGALTIFRHAIHKLEQGDELLVGP